jgi:hypothetical protein
MEYRMKRKVAIAKITMVFMLLSIAFTLIAKYGYSEVVKDGYLENKHGWYVKQIFNNDEWVQDYEYEYAILNNDNTIIIDAKVPCKPDIKWINGIIRVETIMNSSVTEVQYYNYYKKIVSRRYTIPCMYADNISYEFVNKYLISTLDINEDEEIALFIYDIFDNNVIAQIKRDFIAVTSGVNEIIFLTEDHIFVDYDTLDENSNRINHLETIAFKETNKEISISQTE